MTNTSVTIKGQSLIAGLLLFVQMGCWSGSTDINYNISSTGYNFVYEMQSDVGLILPSDEYELKSSSYNRIVDNQLTRAEEANALELDMHFILLLKEDNDEYAASDFLSEQYKLNPTNCINLIGRVFVKDSYRYAKDVIKAIRFSEIPYIMSWFKELLLKAADVHHLKKYISNIYDLYKEALDAI